MIEAELPGHPVAVLSGPGFAADIAKGLPTAMALAASDLDEAARLARLLSGPTFRLMPLATALVCSLAGR